MADPLNPLAGRSGRRARRPEAAPPEPVQLVTPGPEWSDANPWASAHEVSARSGAPEAGWDQGGQPETVPNGVPIVDVLRSRQAYPHPSPISSGSPLAEPEAPDRPWWENEDRQALRSEPRNTPRQDAPQWADPPTRVPGGAAHGRAGDDSDALWLRRLAPPQNFSPQRTPASPQFPPDPHQQQLRERGDERPEAVDAQRAQPQAASPKAGKQRLAWIDTARGLAIILVVVLHAAEWVQETPISVPLWTHVNEVASTLRMPLFFMCAGILATKWLHAAWADLIATKVFFLVWVYLLWQIVGTGQSLVAAQITGDQLSPVRVVAALVLSPLRPRFELWFIWALAIFFVAARLCSRFALTPQLVLAGLGGAVAFSSLVPEINLGWNGVPKYYLFFLIGLYYRSTLLALSQRLSRLRALAAVGGWLLVAVLTYVTELIYLPGVGLVVRLVGLVAGISVALLLQRVTVLAYLGSRTLPIYLAHTPLLVLLTLGLDQVATTAPAEAVKWFLPAVFSVAAVALSLLVHTVVIRTPARMFYEPPGPASELVRRTVARHPAGRERLDPSRVPGLTHRPFGHVLG